MTNDSVKNIIIIIISISTYMYITFVQELGPKYMGYECQFVILYQT